MPLVYIGSGTQTKAGVRSRLKIYDSSDNPTLPVYVKAAMQDGYVAVHKGLLIWTPLPSAADFPRTRLLFVAMEAALSFTFWTMYSRKKDYGMTGFCRWPLELFEYHGLCSHNAMLEGPAGNFDLSSEQLESIAVAVNEKNRLYHVDYYQNNIKGDPAAESLRREAQKRYAQTDKALQRGQRFEERRMESKDYHCCTCNVTCRKQSELDRHQLSKRHKQKAELESRGLSYKPSRSTLKQARAKERGKYFCETCEVLCSSQYELDRHDRSKRHLKRVAEDKSTAPIFGISGLASLSDFHHCRTFIILELSSITNYHHT